MKFDDIHKAREWFLDYKKINTSEVVTFYGDYDTSDWKFGDRILFQHITDKGLVSRPIYAIFTSFTVWDQALVICFIQEKRAWMSSHRVGKDNDKGSLVLAFDDEIETIQFWTDNIKVLGHWKIKPTLIEMKFALSNKLCDTIENRDNIINTFLK